MLSDSILGLHMKKLGRILFLTNSKSGGGAERSINLLANELFSQGLKVSLICINSGPKDIVENLCPTFTLNRRKNFNIIHQVSVLKSFHKVIKIIDPDTLILNCELPELFSCFTSRTIKKVLVEHSSPSWVGRRRLGLIVRNILFNIHKAQPLRVSSHVRVYCGKGLNSIVIPNLVLLPKRLDANYNELKRIVYIGRLDREIKRTHMAVEIAKLLEVPILLIGDGPLIQELDSIKQTMGIDIEHESWTPDPWAKLGKGDLLCLTSENESDGLVAVEAIASGVPVIFSNIQAHRRFNLSEHQYFANSSEAAEKVEKYREALSLFSVKKEKRDEILKDRDIEAISAKWVNFLSSLE